MNCDILECKKKAKDIVSPNDPPRNANGRKKGYIEVMAALWEEKGYGHLGLKSQNLRDQALRLEKMEQDHRKISISIECGSELEIESDKNDERASGENNIQADFQNIGQQRVQNANFVRSLNSDLHMTIRANYADQRPSPWGLSNTKQIDQNKIQLNLPDYVVFPSEIKNKTWGNISHASLCNTIKSVYDEIVHFRRNIFNIPSGRAGKSFIEELTFWIRQFNANADLNSIALKAFMVLPTLILQKPSATSKSKEHSAAIERRLALWRQGELDLLLK